MPSIETARSIKGVFNLQGDVRLGAKAALRIRLNRILEPHGFLVGRFQPETVVRRMLSPTLQVRQLKHLRRGLAAALTEFSPLRLDTIEDKEIAAFLDALATCPVRQQSGGSGVNAALILWLLTRAIQPTLVVESGVLRGFTSWVLRQAAPEAEIHSFDISFSELQWRSRNVRYHEADWMTVDLKSLSRDRGLVFFDDHVDQWRRVREAAARGFRYLVLDDNLPAHALHGDGKAACPTLDMLFDDELQDGELIEWRTECGVFSFRHDRALALATRRLIGRHARLPSMHLCTGYLPANLTLVEIAPELQPGPVNSTQA